MGPEIIANCDMVLEREAVLHAHVEVVSWLTLRGRGVMESASTIGVTTMPTYSVQYGSSHKSHTQTVEAPSTDHVLSQSEASAKKPRRVRVQRIEEYILNDRGQLKASTRLSVQLQSGNKQLACLDGGCIQWSLQYRAFRWRPLAILVGIIWLIKTIWYHV
jgi:hypothetical protein